jgi:hypothetical protein
MRWDLACLQFERASAIKHHQNKKGSTINMSCSWDGYKFDQGHCSTFILIQIYRSFLSHKENAKNVFFQKNANIYEDVYMWTKYMHRIV